MTARNDLDRMITTWFDESAGAGAPDYLGETLDGIARVAQRPAWTLPERWLPMQLTMNRVQVPRLPLVLAVLGLLTAAVVAAALVASGGRRLPPAFGMAGNGNLAYISEGQVWLAAPDGSDPHPLTPAAAAATATRKGAPVFSRDGSRIAYLDFAGSNPTLVVADADGAHPLTIARDAQAMRYVAWAPDGKRLYYSLWVDDVVGQRDRIHVAPVDSASPPRRIGDPGLSAFYPTVSPAGDRIAFVSDHCQPGNCVGGVYTFGLHVMDANGSNVIELASGEIQPALDPPLSARGIDWSPNGRTVLFTGVDTRSGNKIGVYAVAVDGTSTPRRLDEASLMALGGTWSPAGDRIAFLESSRDGDWNLVVADPSGGSRRVVAEAVSSFEPAWSPDGRRLAVMDLATDTEGVIRIVDLDDGAPEVLIPVHGLDTNLDHFGGDGVGAMTWQRVAP